MIGDLCEWGAGIWTAEDTARCTEPVYAVARIRDPDNRLKVGVGPKGVLLEVCHRHFAELRSARYLGT